jgi:hypothetical protein
MSCWCDGDKPNCVTCLPHGKPVVARVKTTALYNFGEYVGQGSPYGYDITFEAGTTLYFSIADAAPLLDMLGLGAR